MKARRSIRRVAGGLVVIGAVAAIAFAWRAHERGQVVRAARPPAPDLRAWPESFRQEVAAASRDSIPAFAKLSRLYHANGFLAEAARCYEALENLQPAEPRWLHRHATILAGYGQAEPAIARWQRVLVLAPDYIAARLRLGELFAKSERPAEAARIYASVLTRKPEEPYALFGLARLDLDAGRWEDARQGLEKVVALTNYDLGYDLLVTVYEHFGEHDRSAALRGRAKAAGSFRDPPDPWVDELLEDCFDAYRLSLAAGVSSRTGERVTAIRLLERAVSIAPEDVAVRFQLAGVHVERGDTALARSQFERCTAIAPKFPDAWAHLGALLDRGGDRRGAEHAVVTGLRHNPQSPGLHLARARQLREAGRNAEAIESYRASIRFRPNEADAHLELATTLFRLERVPEGLVALNQAIAAEPNHPMALALLAFHAITQRDEPAARQWLTAVLNQPRVPREQVEQLLAGFREQFGKSFR
jgi:tetratricopeptide (TPR) repeat protein